MNFNRIVLNSLDKADPNIRRFCRALNGTDSRICTGIFGKHICDSSISSTIYKKSATHDLALLYIQANDGVNFVHKTSNFTNETAQKIGLKQIITTIQNDGKRIISLLIQDKNAKLKNNNMFNYIHSFNNGEDIFFEKLSLEQARKVLKFMNSSK